MLAVVAAVLAMIAVPFGGAATDGNIGWFVGWTIVAIGHVGAFSFVPALIAIVLAEAFGWRSVFFWLAVGGGIGFAGHLLSNLTDEPGYAELRQAMLLGAGFVGGLVYWLVAGRRSGYRPPAAALPGDDWRTIRSGDDRTGDDRTGDDSRRDGT